MNLSYKLTGDFDEAMMVQTFVYIDIFNDENGRPLPHEEHLKRAEYQARMDDLR